MVRKSLKNIGGKKYRKVKFTPTGYNEDMVTIKAAEPMVVDIDFGKHKGDTEVEGLMCEVDGDTLVCKDFMLELRDAKHTSHGKPATRNYSEVLKVKLGLSDISY